MASIRLAVFASGNGSNFSALYEAYQSGKLSAEMVCLICDQREALVIERAKKVGLPYYIVERFSNEAKSTYESRLLKILRAEQVDYLVLAGFMRILGTTLLTAYPQKIINIHPSLLPKYPGKQAIRDAYEDQAREIGVTLHLVDQGIDTGPIIYQEKLECLPGDSLFDLEEKIHALEHRIFPRELEAWLKGASLSS